MSYRARLNRVRTRVGKDPGNVLKISGGGGSSVAMKRATCNKKCVSGIIPGSFSIVGPKPPGDVAPTNVNTQAMLDRKTSYRKYPMGIVEDYTTSGIVNYNYPDKSSHDSSHVTRLKRLQNINQCDCSENLTEVSETISCCKSTVSGTRHRFALNTPTTTNSRIINVVQDKNIKLSSEYMAQTTRLNNDVGWRTRKSVTLGLGKSWTRGKTMPTEAWWNGVAYGNGRFFAVGINVDPNKHKIAMVSEDGDNWTESNNSTGTNVDCYDVVYGVPTGGGAGKFVIVGELPNVIFPARILIANNSGGIENLVTLAGVGGTRAQLHSVINMNDGLTSTWVTVGNDGTVFYNTTDPANNAEWFSPAANAPLPNRNLNGITTNGTIFVAVGYNTFTTNGVIYFSDDLDTWNERAVGEGFQTNTVWRDVTYGNGRFVAVGNSTTDGTKIVYSDDGNTWNSASSIPTTTGQGLYGVTYANNLFVAVGGLTNNSSTGGFTMYSSDGNIWKKGTIFNGEHTTPPDIQWTAVISNGTNKFVAVGQTPDGTDHSYQVMTSKF